MKTAQTERSSLRGDKVYGNTLSLISFDVADKKGLPIARPTTRALRAVPSVAENLALEKSQASPAPVAERGFASTTPGKSSRVRMRRSRKPSRPHFGLASTPTQQKKRRPSFSNGHKVTLLVLESTSPN